MKTALRNIFLPVFFMISSWSYAQVVDAPTLHCVSVDSTNDVVLDWSVPNVSCGGGFHAYYIFRATSINGPYSLIDSILIQGQTSYTDNVGNGGSVTYYYYMQSNFICPGFTFAYSDTLDNLSPVTPPINFVTVNNGLAEINWQPSVSTEASGYIIYNIYNQGNHPIDTIYGRFNTDYIDVNSTPGIDSEGYTIAVVDSCYNTGRVNEQSQHTIYLSDSVIRCEQKIILKWYFYHNWQKGIQKYDIEMSKNGAPYVILQSVPANVLTYPVSGFNDRDSVCFKIVAKENITGFTSESNVLCRIVNVVQPVKDFYVRNVTVIAPNKILVSFSMDSISDVSKLMIQRGTDTIAFTQLANISPPYNFSTINQYTDTTAFTDVNSYYYRLIAIDSCGASDTSTRGKSILLKGYAFTDLSFFVKWDASWFDSADVMQYDVYRKDDAGFNFQNSVLPDVFSYEEKNLPVDTPCYYVEAVDTMKLPNGIVDTIHSRSNIVCLNQPSEIYMPNAFAPLGQNNSFKPILNLQGLKSYSFSIYNRWGEQLFFSENSYEGWDGTYKGVYVQQGAYAYVVDVIDGNGKHVNAKGTVLVIR
ncbi:MAG TPA: gliding motility-associated C-terminal domain-containing protein [Chitinophagales bacterium]|nr:gliding motility-associated C-terminal domain-containing protein [Chitinophagales bacterium]